MALLYDRKQKRDRADTHTHTHRLAFDPIILIDAEKNHVLLISYPVGNECAIEWIFQFAKNFDY